jgi:hypothetical protein
MTKDPDQQPMPATSVAAPKTSYQTAQRYSVAAPANAIALPPDDILLPTGEEVEIAHLEPAKFLSSASYLMVIAESKQIRRSLRQSDDVVKEALGCHEQLEQHYKRVASDMNAVQEQFIRIDSALFDD